MSELGELFRQIRLDKNWSIRKAANKMGISYSYLSILEKGVDPRTGKDSSPRPETLKIISKAYNYPYEELMKAAGYLDENESLGRKFDLAIFVSNVNLLMGAMSVEKFSEDIYAKTGYHIKSTQIRSYLNGDIEPFPGTFNILCKYAEVTMDFWYKFNTPETLAKEKSKYRETINKPFEHSFTKDYESFTSLNKDIKTFVSDSENIPYIEIAMEAQKKNLNSETLKNIVETMINEIDNNLD
ncbi:UNVERIFIED_CONTAM: putative transcriptional regulators [Acetivibrio alkalicellulosi]